MAKIIGIVQVKGGAGRSTLATNLAGELSKQGRTVLIDGDMPQGTSASWYAIRQQGGKAEGLTADTAKDHRELIEKVEHYRQQADYIVLDGPPRIAEMTRAMLVLADLCLIPVGASVAEIWATTDVLTLIERSIASDKPRIDFQDDVGFRQRLWSVTDPAVLAKVVEIMQPLAQVGVGEGVELEIERPQHVRADRAHRPTCTPTPDRRFLRRL